MHNIFRLVKHVRPHPPRAFSTTSRLADSSRPLRSIKYIDVLRKEADPTHEPLWHFLHCLSKTTHKNDMSMALARQGVSVDEFRRWKPILYESDIVLTVGLLDGWGFKVRKTEEEENVRKEIPIWVLLYTMAFKVRTPQHAHGPLLDLFYAYVDTIPPSARGPFFVFTMLHLARFNLIQPMNTLADMFLTTPFPLPPKEEQLYFNLILQSISAKPTPLPENAHLAVRLLRAMQGRQLKLRPDTYEALLNDRFVTLELTKYLLTQMNREGTVKTKEHLEAYLRVFARDGVIHDASKYLGAVHALQGKDDVKKRANTYFLAALEDRASAFKFLHDLAGEGVPASSIPVPMEERSTTPARTPPRPQHRQTTIDTYDITSLLFVLSKDLKVPYTRLIATFEKLPTRPSIVTWTVFIRGLLWRKKYLLAEKYTRKMIHIGLPLDKESLSVATQSYIRAGNPHMAIWLLERYAGDALNTFTTKPVKVTVTMMNDIMSSLNKIKRPDVVFRLWDNMSVLYNVFQNSQTLDIMLQAARIAMRMDTSVSGALAEWKLLFTLKRPSDESEGKKRRRDALKEVMDVVGNTKKPKEYKDGIWNGKVGVDTAREVFLHILFSTPYAHALWEIKSPVGSVRSSINEDQGLFLPRMKPSLYTFTSPPSFTNNPPDPHKNTYPSIQLTPSNLHQYILLLGLSERSAEIPLVLAWMKSMNLAPDKNTQAAALAFFGDVSVHAPLVEVLAGGYEKSEFAKLRRWLEEWLDVGSVVGEEEVGRWRRIGDLMKRGKVAGEG